MKGWKGIVWTLGLVFFVSCAQAFINVGGDLFSLDVSGWQLVINAGVSAVLAFVVNYASPWVDRYGISKE